MRKTLSYRPINLNRWVIWSAFAALLIVAPLIFNQGRSLSLLCQIGTLMIFGLSFNMLLGQGGMLSFGHAVYSGLGAFFAIHAMNRIGSGALIFPVTLIPLVGGLAGLFFGCLFGYVTTKKSGTTFSMITLGMVELVFACSLMFPGFFGGEGGITTNRVIGPAVMGISYGPQIQVYYLIAFWLFVSTIGMYAWSHTPLGRMANAVRDNPERAEFIGYDAQWVRYLTLIVSAFFAGISGALSAINFEIVSAENVSAIRSGVVLLFTFIGGIGFFFGPMIGAVVGVFFSIMLSDYTKAWQLYLGSFFIAMVMFAPGGIAGVLMLNLRVIKYGQVGRLWRAWLSVAAFTVMVALGAVLAIEMLYRMTLGAADGAQTTLFGFQTAAAAATGWLLAALLIAFGGYGFRRAKSAFAPAWDVVNAEIDDRLRSTPP
ncbi:branched-chain amino acid ABC transporter permease [Undibacterium arcticum]|uniref:Branched-chain amino acid ABC transporter permease n=1 Tax=Undibacterium arcticum TaxID=1762892 RepID=A0ABV7EV27_9BURK